MSDYFQDSEIAEIRRAAVNVLGSTDAGRAIALLCDQHAQNLQQLSNSRIPDANIIAIVGATGQGKSWLARQWVSNASVRRAILSGDNQHESTRRLYWVGSQSPVNIDSLTETFLYCGSDEMLDLGGPYVIVDTPGATDVDRNTSESAARAIAMSSVLVLVVRRDQIRSEVPYQIAETSDGTLILPVVSVIRTALDDTELRRDIDDLIQRLRQSAPRGEFLSPLLIRDFEVVRESEDVVSQSVRESLTERLRSHIASGQISARRRGMRILALKERFHQQLRQHLAEHLPRLTRAIEHLNEATQRLPYDVAVELIGSGQTLRAGIRARLRAEMLVSTAPVCFPYRTVLGLLNLTNGAWDRVILALSGSLPSLVGAAWSSFKNLSEAGESFKASAGIRSRSKAMIEDRIIPLVDRFHSELSRLRTAPSSASETFSSIGPRSSLSGQGIANREVAAVDLQGIDSLQEQTQRIFDDEVMKASPATFVVQLCGVIGTLIFWALLAGPIIALYRSYFAASYQSISALENNLDSFPHPTAAMIFTSVILSLLPMAIFAMLALTWVQRRSRQEQAAINIDQRIRTAIEDLQSQGVLRLDFRDPVLDDTRCLTQLAVDPNGQRSVSAIRS